MLNHGYLGSEHFLLGLIREGDGIGGKVLQSFGVSSERAREQVEEVVGRGLEAPTGHIPFTPNAKKALHFSLREALQLGHGHIGTEHILLGLFCVEKALSNQILTTLGVQPAEIRHRTVCSLQGMTFDGGGLPMKTIIGLSANRSRAFAEPAVVVDLRQEARGAPATIVGRDQEIIRLAQILLRRGRRSVLLVGPSGVGKTALMNGFAARVEDGCVPESLRDLRIVAVDLAGPGGELTSDGRAAFLRAVWHCVNRDMLLSIENAHLLLSQSTGSIAFEFEAVESHIANGRLQAVLSVEDPAAQEALTRVPALSDRLVVLPLEEPDLARGVSMLRQATHDLVAHYRVSFTDLALAVAFAYAHRYPSTKAAPGRILELLEEAAALARVQVEGSTDSGSVQALTRKIADVTRRMESALDAGAIESAGRLVTEQRQLLQLRAAEGLLTAEVTGETVRSVLELVGSSVPAVEAVGNPADGTVKLVSRLLPARETSTAILIGAATYTDGTIPDLPSVASNLTDLRAALTDPEHGAFASDRVHIFADWGWKDVPRMASLAAESGDTLLVYYAGHGFSEDDGLYLGLSETDHEHVGLSAFPYAHLRKLVIGGMSRRCVVILDCCYSGAAIGLMSAADAPNGELDIRGAYVLTATANSDKAHAPEGARNSAFTGALLRVLTEGIPGGSEVIRIEELHPALTGHLRAENRPLPRQRASDTIGEPAIGRNPCWRSS